MKPKTRKLASKKDYQTLVAAWAPEDSLISHSTPYEVIGDTSHGFQTLQMDSSGTKHDGISPVQPKSPKKKQSTATKSNKKHLLLLSPVSLQGKQSKQETVSPRYQSDLKTTYSVSHLSPQQVQPRRSKDLVTMP